MKIILAKYAGFCFGVERAINTLKELKNNINAKIYTIGPIIHNPQVVEDFKKIGIYPIDEEDIDNLSDEYVVIRSHGVSNEVYHKLQNKNLHIIDTTCPYVKNVHKKVEYLEKNNYKVVVLGKRDHPEVEGIIGHCKETPYIINSDDDLDNFPFTERIGVVAQTTSISEVFKKFVAGLSLKSTEMLVYNTICDATEKRQSEAIEIAKKCDKMIVIGGKNSSNSNKLKEIAKQYLEHVFFIETAEELDVLDFSDNDIIGITAGASTPKESINGVLEFLKNNFNVNLEIFQSLRKQKEEN